MDVPRLKKRPRRLCEHCDTELCQTQYFDHRKRYFKNGVWEKKSKRARSDNIQRLLLSSHDPTGVSYVPSMCKDLEDNLAGVGEIDESEMHEGPEKEVMEESEEMHPATDSSDNDETADDQSIHLFLDSSDSESVQDDEDISCYMTRFWKLVQIYSDQHRQFAAEGATAERLYTEMKSFTDADVPIENIVGFGSDGCNTMMGKHNSVSSHLRNDLPGITVQRWLSLSEVVKCVSAQWNALRLFFTDQWLEARLTAAENIFSSLNDESLRLYYYFLEWVLPKFTDLNQYFQSEKVVITSLKSKVCETYTDLLLTFMDRDYVLRTPLNQIEINDGAKLRPLNTLYLGVKVMQHVQQAKIPAATLTDFHVRCQNFLRVACGEIKKRFDFDDALLTQIVCLSPATATDAKARAEHPSLLPLMQQVPRLIDMADADRLQAIDDQWRRLPLVALSEDTKAMDVDELWHHISTLEDFEGERRRKRRRYWIHPIVTRREEHGEFYRLVQELKMYHERFRGYFRMSVSEFENLLQQLAPSLTKEQTHYRKPIDPEQRLAVCLRFLSTGDSYRTIASSFRLGVSTVASINHATEDDHDCEQTLQGFEHCRGQRASVEAQNVRELYKEYFNAPAGEVAWQYDHVNHGLGNR
ncbi:hypothetical protein DPX16_1403 [Anabarilius grahami]|uniref:Uncharacterized protein n=1 Tax=Anabarilius grahami TaxID=495550 RepID=A0A3N0XD41_ANAGA|nr:hypothetical protein DPX16_1403 [Anabarilius grahami]